MTPKSKPIPEYTVIGDCQTVALVATGQSTGCASLRFDSPSCFAALLGTPEHGHWQILPSGQVRQTRRRYWEVTLVLETEFETDTDSVTVFNLMPPRSGAPDLVRIVACTRGGVRMAMNLTVRFAYGSVAPWVRQTGGGIRASAGPERSTFARP